MKRIQKWYILMLIGSVLVLLFSAEVSAADDWPNKTIRLTICYGPGGTTDLSSRLLASLIEKELGQKVICENKAGGAGVLAASIAATQEPDGYNIFTLPTTPAVIAPHRQKLSYNPLKDLTPICQFATWHFALVVKTDSPFKNLKDLISYAKENPGELSYGLSGSGNTQHLVMERIKMETGAEMKPVPFKSGAEAVSACMGGHVTMMAGVTEWLPQVKAGALRLLAVFDADRMKEFPEIPTLKESGYNITANAFLGLAGPAGIPENIVKKIDSAVAKAIKEPDFIELMDKIMLKIQYQSHMDFKETIHSKFEEEGKVLRKLGLAMEN